MNLHDHLADLEDRARIAFKILDGDDTGQDRAAFREALALTPDDDLTEEAQDYFGPGYEFTPDAGSPVVAVLTVGGPDIHVIRDGADYSLVGYRPGHPGAARSSAVITRWGQLLDAQRTV